MEGTQQSFPGFTHSPLKLRKYILTAGVFTIMMNDEKIIHHEPEDIHGFSCWLEQNKIENIRDYHLWQKKI